MSFNFDEEEELTSSNPLEAFSLDELVDEISRRLKDGRTTY